MAAKHPTLFDYFDQPKQRQRYGRTQYGGTKTKGRRKLERPLSTKHWIHLVLKSDKAKGRLSLLTPEHQVFIAQVVKAKARKFGILVAEQVNMGNHVHLKIKTSSRVGFQAFLRSITTLIARRVTGARRGKPFGKFWQGLAFTRVLKSSLEELQLRGYFTANRVEAKFGPRVREDFLRQFNTWVYRDRRAAAPG